MLGTWMVLTLVASSLPPSEPPTAAPPSAVLLPRATAPIEPSQHLLGARLVAESLIGLGLEVGLGFAVTALPLGHSGPSDISFPTALFLIPVGGFVGAMVGTWLGAVAFGLPGAPLPWLGAALGTVGALVLGFLSLALGPVGIVLAIAAATAPVVGSILQLEMEASARTRSLQQPPRL